MPQTLALILLPFLVWSGISPVDRATWWAEIIPVTSVFLLFVFTFKKFRFSNIAYLFAAVWLYMHTIGAHYTFERVPFRFFNDFFGQERNQYDRIAHFAIGFYAFAVAELVQRKNWITNRAFIFLFALFSIMSLAASYELIEWIYAVKFGGTRASDFLGSQGDIWDAQKDILADTLGALFSLMFYPWRSNACNVFLR